MGGLLDPLPGQICKYFDVGQARVKRDPFDKQKCDFWATNLSNIDFYRNVTKFDLWGQIW